MKNLFLGLSIIGFILPSILVFQESIETGNILLYAHPIATFKAMFANRISSIFAIDLLFGVLVFFLWVNYEGKKIGMKGIGWVYLLTMLLGLAGGLPLFLYLREKKTGGA